MSYYANLIFPFGDGDAKIQKEELEAYNDKEAIEEAEALVKQFNDALRKVGNTERYGLSSVHLRKIVKNLYGSWTDKDTRKEINQAKQGQS